MRRACWKVRPLVSAPHTTRERRGTSRCKKQVAMEEATPKEGGRGDPSAREKVEVVTGNRKEGLKTSGVVRGGGKGRC